MLRTLGATVPKAAAGEAMVASTARALTQIPDPTPAVRAIKKRLVTYKRKDGVDLSFTLYTPPDRRPTTPTSISSWMTRRRRWTKRWSWASSIGTGSV
jgi:dipeptidyl aminopeptidase/acylaminoacyl peptidase